MKIKYCMLMRYSSGMTIHDREGDIRIMLAQADTTCNIYDGQFCLDAKVGKD